MKALALTPTVLNTDDRTVDVTIQFKTDANVLVATKVLSVPADKFNQSVLINRMRDMLITEWQERQTYPLNQAQADDICANVEIRIPG